MAVEQLLDLALGDGVGGVRQDVHHAHVIDLDHHFERARIEEIAHQHAGLVAPDGVGGRVPAAQLGGVHDIVMQQRGGVDELDNRGEQDVGLGSCASLGRCPARPTPRPGARIAHRGERGGEQHQYRSQALPPLSTI